MAWEAGSGAAALAAVEVVVEGVDKTEVVVCDVLVALLRDVLAAPLGGAAVVMMAAPAGGG
jgi:hypothetical protein